VAASCRLDIYARPDDQTREKVNRARSAHRARRNQVIELARQSDIVIENFRQGTLEKWGLGPDVMNGANPDVIIARISASGQTGPMAPTPGFAAVAEAIGGLRELVGELERPPSRVGVSISDSIAGLYAAFGAVMALFRREKIRPHSQPLIIAYLCCLPIARAGIGWCSWEFGVCRSRRVPSHPRYRLRRRKPPQRFFDHLRNQSQVVPAYCEQFAVFAELVARKLMPPALVLNPVVTSWPTTPRISLSVRLFSFCPCARIRPLIRSSPDDFHCCAMASSRYWLEPT
jgi:hypothetical protein